MLMLFLFFPVQSCSAAQESSNSVTASSTLLKENLQLHRMVIMDAISKRQATMPSVLQTEFHKKLTSELLRNGTNPMETTELALWISALIAGKENPRNYNSLDLVQDLLHRVKITTDINPFYLLTLCNAHALLPEHLSLLTDFDVNTSTAKQALSLKTLACADTLPNSAFRRVQFQDASDKIAAALAAKQTKDGHFGDMFSTSLATQALTCYGKQLWLENAALDVLQKELETQQRSNIVKAYYITSAINARRVNFLKDLYHGSYEPQRKVKQMYIYVHLAIRYENHDLEFSLKVQTPNSWNLLQILNRVAELSENFRFSYSKVGSETNIFEVDGTPNDPEKNLYWIICSKKRNMEEYNLEDLYPYANEHIDLWYRTTKCPPVQQEVSN